MISAALETERGAGIQDHVGAALDMHLIARLYDVGHPGVGVAAPRHRGAVIGAEYGLTLSTGLVLFGAADGAVTRGCAEIKEI